MNNITEKIKEDFETQSWQSHMIVGMTISVIIMGLSVPIGSFIISTLKEIDSLTLEYKILYVLTSWLVTYITMLFCCTVMLIISRHRDDIRKRNISQTY